MLVVVGLQRMLPHPPQESAAPPTVKDDATDVVGTPISVLPDERAKEWAPSTEQDFFRTTWRGIPVSMNGGSAHRH